MFCSNCGSNIGSFRFCPNCGAPAATPGGQGYAPPQYAPPPPRYAPPPPQPQYTPPQPQYSTPPSHNPSNLRPMAWYKFLVNFGLIAGAILNGIFGFVMITGVHYGELADLLYTQFPSLKLLDIVNGLMGIGLGAFAVSVRMDLANFCESGPRKLTILYVLSAISTAIYYIGCFSILSPRVIEQFFLVPSLFLSLASSVVTIILNRIYFSKRSDLFDN